MSPATTRSGTGADADLFFEDLTPGRTFDLGVTTVDGAEMVAFARRFDPQWYHVDDELAQHSHHGGLIASGFFTVSLFMRAYVDHVLARAAADASPGLEELRWLAPVRAGDRLAVRLDVMGSKPSTARPGLGTVTLTGTMLRLGANDQPDQEVLRTRFRGWFALRPDPAPEPEGPPGANSTPAPVPAPRADSTPVPGAPTPAAGPAPAPAFAPGFGAGNGISTGDLAHPGPVGTGPGPGHTEPSPGDAGLATSTAPGPLPTKPASAEGPAAPRITPAPPPVHPG